MSLRTLILFISILFCFAIATDSAFSEGWLSPVQLTDNTASEQVPVINADGTKIVYYSAEDSDDDIYIMEDKNGTWHPSYKLTFNSTSDTMPTINDQGNRIAFIGGEINDRSIYFVEYADGTWGEPTKITDNSLNDYFPSINADGNKIIFQSKDKQGKRYIRFIEFIEGKWTNPITLPSLTDNNMFPEINSDGTKVCFHAEEDGYRHIYFSEYIDNSWLEPLILTEGDEQNIQISINSDGTKIVYYWTGEKFLPHVMPEAIADIRFVEYKQGSWQLPITIAGSSLYEFDPTISGDGSRVTYSESNPGHPDNIYVVEYKNGFWQTPENLTRNVTSGFRPYINDNGDKIVYYGTSVMDIDYEVYLLSYDHTAGSISGKVIISPSGDPLESALVSADPGGYLTTTDGAGIYLLNVPSGTYIITVVADCFEPSSNMDVVVKEGVITDQNFTLYDGNCFPNPPANPSPPDGASDQDIISTLSWEGSDPDQDPLTYDIFLGKETEHHIHLELVSSNHSQKYYKTDLLDYSTIYYWQVIAKDDKGGDKSSSLWHFTTERCPLSSMVEGKLEDIHTMRKFRDNILKNSVDGKRYIEWYHKYGPEILSIIASNSYLRAYASKLIGELIPKLKCILNGKRIMFSSNYINRIGTFTQLLYPLASPELQTIIKKIRKDLKNERILRTFHGNSVE